MNVRWGNFARTTITNSGGISAVATSVTVASVSGMPSISGDQYFYLVLKRASDGAREIVKVTAVASTTLTIVRAQESTTGLVMAQGDEALLTFTAATLQAIIDELTASISANEATAATAVATAEAASTLAASALAKFPVQTADIGDLQVTTGKLASGAVTNAKIADGTIDLGAKSVDASLTTAKVAANAITAAKIDENAINFDTNYVEYTHTDEGVVLPGAAACEKPRICHFTAYRTGAGARIDFSLQISGTYAFAGGVPVITVSLDAALAANEYVAATFVVPAGWWFRVVKTAGGTDRGWSLRTVNLGA